MRHVAILVFDQVEVLDFAGPYEVFNVTGEKNDPTPFNVFTVAESTAPVRTRGQFSVNPNYSIYTMPPAQVLVIPGGRGARALLDKPHILEWLREQHEQVEHMVSVCTGALPLGKTGLLDGLTVTTHHGSIDHLRSLVSENTTVLADQRYTDNGKVLTAGGISAGIDLSLYLVRKLLGDDVLAKTLTEMEYAWTPATDLVWKEKAAALTE